jgi:hypothetical protein
MPFQYPYDDVIDPNKTLPSSPFESKAERAIRLSESTANNILNKTSRGGGTSNGHGNGYGNSSIADNHVGNIMDLIVKQTMPAVSSNAKRGKSAQRNYGEMAERSKSMQNLSKKKQQDQTIIIRELQNPNSLASIR